MICPKCKSENVNVQAVNEQTIKNKHHGIIWWCCIGWWWIMIKWIVFTFPALIIAIFGRKKKQIKNNIVSHCVCQNCGHTWKA